MSSANSLIALLKANYTYKKTNYTREKTQKCVACFDFLCHFSIAIIKSKTKYLKHKFKHAEAPQFLNNRSELGDGRNYD